MTTDRKDRWTRRPLELVRPGDGSPVRSSGGYTLADLINRPNPYWQQAENQAAERKRNQ